MARTPRNVAADLPDADVVPMFSIDARTADPVFTYTVVGARPVMVNGVHARNAYGNLLYAHAKDGATYVVTANTVDPVVRQRLGVALTSATVDVVARVLVALNIAVDMPDLIAAVMAYQGTGDNLFSAITRAIEDVEDDRADGSLRSPHLVARGVGMPVIPAEADPVPE
jgi:hypothetical protein